MISVQAYKTYQQYKTGMTDLTELQEWLKATTREDWPTVLINVLIKRAKDYFGED